MFKLKSRAFFDTSDGRRVFAVDCPIETERTPKAMKEAIGSIVEIDGVLYEPAGFEFYPLAIKLRIGEKFGIAVRVP